mgnify:CR=1 FL=1
MNGYWKKWWAAAGVRAVKTFAQVAASGITLGATLGDISWTTIASVAAVSAIYSLLTSLAGIPEVPREDEEGDLE